MAPYLPNAHMVTCINEVMVKPHPFGEGQRGHYCYRRGCQNSCSYTPTFHPVGTQTQHLPALPSTTARAWDAQLPIHQRHQSWQRPLRSLARRGFSPAVYALHHSIQFEMAPGKDKPGPNHSPTLGLSLVPRKEASTASLGSPFAKPAELTGMTFSCQLPGVSQWLLLFLKPQLPSGS